MSVNQFVQVASKSTPPGGKYDRVKFTSLSRQEQYPGSLMDFFRSQSVLYPMPKGVEALPNMNEEGMMRQYASSNTAYKTQTRDSLDAFFEEQHNGRTKYAENLTPEMRAWGTPLEYVGISGSDIA